MAAVQTGERRLFRFCRRRPPLEANRNWHPCPQSTQLALRNGPSTGLRLPDFVVFFFFLSQRLGFLSPPSQGGVTRIGALIGVTCGRARPRRRLRPAVLENTDACFMCFVGSPLQPGRAEPSGWRFGVGKGRRGAAALCLLHGALEGALVPWHRSWSGVGAWQSPVAASLPARGQKPSGVP